MIYNIINITWFLLKGTGIEAKNRVVCAAGVEKRVVHIEAGHGGTNVECMQRLWLLCCIFKVCSSHIPNFYRSVEKKNSYVLDQAKKIVWNFTHQ
jgi:hypothetical protein